MRTPPTALVLRQARLHLLEHGESPPAGLDERVARSWRRSLAAGLLPGGRLLDTAHANAAELSRVIASQHDLLVHSRPVMEVLFSLVRDSQSMVVLADRGGILMHTLGQPDFLPQAQSVALSCGASWHEQHRGTNAIGTALAEGCGVEIHGGEHFFERNDFLTCTAAPIHSSTGELLGVLDISGDQRADHPHTFGLVSMAVRMIENRLIDATCRQHIRLHLHRQREGVGSVGEGIVAITADGWVVGANRAGLDALRLTTADLGSVQLKALLDMALEGLLFQQKRYPDQAMLVHRSDGLALFVQVRQDAATLPVDAPAGAGSHQLARVSASVGAGLDALQQLDVGDARWRSAADKVRRVLDKPIALLIQGESGVGKELFARAAHASGPRRGKPFVAINCAAIPENLIEAELFGYAPGAFTGARREGSPGRLREAQGGTLFLDEVGDMPLTMQARLLRVLQERKVSPLGGGSAVAVDFFLICATHCKLREAAEAGHFRSDLYYRINGLKVHLPALRERSDFVALTEQILADLKLQHGVHVAPELLARLGHHPWPGNLRQYANALRTASAMLEPRETCIDWQHLSDDLQEELTKQADPVHAAHQGAMSSDAGDASSQSLNQLSRLAIHQALSSSSGNVSQAARRLGISRQTLYRKLRD